MLFLSSEDDVIAVLIGLVSGWVILWLWQKLVATRRRVSELVGQMTVLEVERNRIQRENEEQRVAVRILEHEVATGRELVQGTEALMEKTRQWVCEKFEAASQDAVLRSQRTFFDMAKETFQQYHALISSSVEKKQSEVSTVILPLRASLEQMEKKVHELELARRGAYDALSTNLQQLSSTQQLLYKETGNLVRALREPTVRGRWGEIQLRRVVEVAGMLPYCDFEEQVSVVGDEGSLRPDMVVKLPNDRLVVIDSKVSLGAYLDALQAEDPDVRREKLVQHAKYVRQHVVRLAQKRYWDQFPRAPDFVVLFLHGDCFLAPALEHDVELLEFASSQKVLLATPTSLIAMLKVIAYSWGEAKIEQHAQMIIDEARLWLDRCKIFSSHFCEIGKHLERGVRAYDKAVGSFETRLLASVRRLAASGLDVSELETPISLHLTPAPMQHERAEQQEPALASDEGSKTAEATCQ
jgi:DNA recombination protein RmuC